jgi:type IV secretory pathway protease TraF
LRLLKGPYLLWAAGAMLLVAGLVSFRTPILVAAATLIALGFWALRHVEVPVRSGPYLLLAGAAALLAAGYASNSAFLCFVAAAGAGLGAYAWMHEENRR